MPRFHLVLDVPDGPDACCAPVVLSLAPASAASPCCEEAPAASSCCAPAASEAPAPASACCAPDVPAPAPAAPTQAPSARRAPGSCC